jgi:glycosyltransferase involved in cell wall biosynthesis
VHAGSVRVGPRMTDLRVCIDARLPGATFGGIEQAIIGLAAGLSRLDDGGEEYLFLTHPDHDEWIRPYLEGPCRPLHTRMEFPGQGGFGRVRKALRERLPPNGLERAVISSDGTAERAGAEVMHLAVQEAFLTEIPSIYQPHDLQHLHLPDRFSSRSRRRRELVYRTHCERAALVVAMTSWGRHDLIERYGLPPEKVAVVPWGSVLAEYPEPTPGDLDELRARLALAEGFLLYPSQTWPHKNHERLLEAIALVRDRHGVAVPLVCPGRRSGEFRRIEARMRELELDATTRFPGFVTPVELRGLYKLATALVFPSSFEGWGLPICEAFAAGLPIASSDATSLPDLVGDAGLLFSPGDAEQMAERIWRLWSDPELRSTLAERGRRRGESFSFDRTARLFRARYRQLADRPATDEDRILLASRSPV